MSTITGLQLRSQISKGGELELSLSEVTTPEPGPDQVVVKVEATPINPSDLGLLIGPADMSTAKAAGSGAGTKVTAKVPGQALPFIAARLDQAMPVGNEGAGTVVKAGSSEAAQALLGKTVSMIGGGMYAQYRLLEGHRLPAPARRHDGSRGCVVVRQSADGARHDRDHEARRPQGAGPYRGRLQPRPDAEQDLPGGRHSPGEHRAQRRAGEAAARHRRQACGRIRPRPVSPRS